MQAMPGGVQVRPEFEELQVVREEMQVTSVFNWPVSTSPRPGVLVQDSSTGDLVSEWRLILASDKDERFSDLVT